MKSFVALCIFFVMLELSATVAADLEVAEDNLVDQSMKEAELDESARNFILAANENLQEDDIAAEEQRGGPCLARRCPRGPRGRSVEEQMRYDICKPYPFCIRR